MGILLKNYISVVQVVFTLWMYFLGACLFAGAILPADLLFLHLWNSISPQTIFQKALIVAVGMGFGYFIFGLVLMTETILCRFIFRFKLKEGEYPLFSVESFKWVFVNSMILIVKFTFMDFIKATPLLPFYFRCMGAKIGKGVLINSKDIGDVSLLEVGDGTVIGGEVVLIAHIAEQGILKFKKTRIGGNVTVGLGAVLMPGCEIGDHSVIAARSVLPKNTLVPPYSVFAGSPAKFIRSVERGA